MANFIAETETSEWVVNCDKEIATHKDQDVRNDVQVMILPACYRVPLEQYTPKLWHFGLHNRDVLHPSESERLKKALAAASKPGPWDKFCASVVDDPEGVLRAYGLDQSKPKFSMSQVQYLLTLDALTIFFVFVHFAFPFPPVKMEEGVNLIRTHISWGYAHVPFDLFLFENQIPMALLTKVYSKYYEHWGERNSPSNWDMILKANIFLMCGYIFKLTAKRQAKIEKLYPQGELAKCRHIVDCVYKILCGKNLSRQPEGTANTIQSATALKKAGIQIEGVEGLLDKVRFRKRCLSLPIVQLYDQTESYFRSLAMYEFMADHNSFKCPVGEYLQLMTSLIKEKGDVKHLIDCGVIENKLGSDKNAFQMWNSLQSGLFLRHNSKEYEVIVSEINKQCKSSLYVMRTEFYQKFLSRPWSVIALITAIIAFVLSGIIAYTAITGSHKMQPEFPS
jgi:hypothetical protein